MTQTRVADDGYYHPSSVEGLRELVERAHTKGAGLRVRGSSHSIPAAIYNDGFAGKGAPPEGPIEIMLDNMRAVSITPDADGEHAVVEVDAGCHLGKAPYDPTGTASWASSLNYQLQERGYALDDLGGISQQTVSGFMLTGSSGGSLQHSAAEAITRMQIIDGTGKLHDVRRDDPDPKNRELFEAAGVSMGLLGVVAKVWFRVGRSYNVVGNELTTGFDGCAFDLLGDGLVQHLRQAPYTRILWWPQHDFDRIQVWQCEREAPRDDFERKPFRILTRRESLGGSLIMTLLGNCEDIEAVQGKLGDWYEHLDAPAGAHDDDVYPERAGESVTREETMAGVKERLRRAVEKHPDLVPGFEDRDEALGAVMRAHDLPPTGGWNEWVSDALTAAIEKAVEGTLEGLSGRLLGSFLKRFLPSVVDELLGFFVPEGKKEFADHWLYGLPMDNQMDDQLWPTQFTELWIPLDKTAQAMNKLRAYYGAGGDVDLAYKRTRAYACELYAAKKSPFWLSPAYDTDCFRVDPFWFGRWAGSAGEFFAPVWDELSDLGFRLHWGKHLPTASEAWRRHYRQVLPKLDDFLALRKQLDPKQIFVTNYWREHLGITKA